MRMLDLFNEGWVFHRNFAESLTTVLVNGEQVTLPHNAVDLPFSYFDEAAYQRAFTYQKVVRADPAWSGKEVSLVFDGAMADSEVYLNGEKLAGHTDGYTPFEVRLTGKLKAGDNLVCVKIDGTENKAIPPFGDTIDYLTYAGIYREAWLKVTAPVSIGTVKVETPDALAEIKTVTVRVDLANPQSLPLAGALRANLRDANSRIIASASSVVTTARVHIALDNLTGLSLWQLDDPTLYTVELVLDTEHGSDISSTTFGFRVAEFTATGFRFNGKPLKIRGLNRHQSFPYVGYAMGRSAQEADANILKHDLKVNLVRTSHYPQSTWFLDHCDRIGLLVFEEIPGWQHVGDLAWQEKSIENVRNMITRDWNHPSIVIWGVRVNESQDRHDFYAATNALARELDSTRQTGGVRYITESEMLEDVYTMNDFVLGNEELPGANQGRVALRDQQLVTGLPAKVPYLITEFNGHMFPTKSFDQEQRQAEHVTRHLQVLDAAYGDPSISGAIGWCMFDYNTHKDFGSGDRICHHGVMDMFREPKFAAYAYASQAEPHEGIVMQPVTYWARGERNIGGTLPLIILTNCDAVELSYGDARDKTVGPDRERFPHLPHPPVIIDQRHFSKDELGLWGMKWENVRITGFLGGKAVKSLTLYADPLPTKLEVAPDNILLKAGSRDTVRVIVRALDQGGSKLPFMQEPITVSVEGPARLVGPSVLPLRGGSTGFWIETTGAAGEITLSVSHDRFGMTTTHLNSV